MNHFATTMLAFGIMVAALSTARADTTCPPNPTLGSTVNGNLIVSGGQTCTLSGVTVTGNVQVQTNAALIIGRSTIVGNVSVGTGAQVTTLLGSLTIDGNVEANQCLFVSLGPGDTIGGNVQIQYCTEQSTVFDDDIGGNFACNNSSGCLVNFVQVNGNVEINDNSSAQIFENLIGNNLQCQGNATISGGGNSVGGKETGQCAHF